MRHPDSTKAMTKGQESNLQVKKQVAVEAFDPDRVVEQAAKAAEALKKVIEQKKRKVIINGEQYLEFEDWQTLGKFYGITAGAVETEEIVKEGKIEGYLARAMAWRNGIQVSAADAQCLREEKNWSDKPLFQLRSMAQTRACAKALRNVLAYVVVLAGYKPTPAEEIVNGNGNQLGQVNKKNKCQYCGTTGKYHKKGCPGQT